MAERIFLIFTLAPVLKGFISMMISGFAFPLCGVMVLKMNLLSFRYMLMHGVILGGAISLAFSLPLTPVTIFINLILVFLMLFFSQGQEKGFSASSAVCMVLSMAVASLIMHIKNVPAKNTLSLIWGSPFALAASDIILLIFILIFLILYVTLNFKNISALFFNQEVAKSLGVKVKVNYTIMLLILAFTIALAMKLLGAFLIDSLLILPALCLSAFDSSKMSMKKLFLFSSIFGFTFSVIGYILALAFNWPPAASVSLVAGGFYIIVLLISKIKK